MNQTINAETLNNIISEMQRDKILKKIKVTTEFAYCLDKSIDPLPQYEPHKFYPGVPGWYYQGVPIEIDDEIDGLYEFVY